MCNSADNIIWQITKRGLKKKKEQKQIFPTQKKRRLKRVLKTCSKGGIDTVEINILELSKPAQKENKKTQTIQESLKQTSKFKTVEQNSNVTVTPKHNNRDKISSRRPNIPVYNLSNFGSKFFNLPLEFMYLFLLKKT